MNETLVWFAIYSAGSTEPFFMQLVTLPPLKRGNYLEMLQEFTVPQLQVKNDLVNSFLEGENAPGFVRLVRDFLNIRFLVL